MEIKKQLFAKGSLFVVTRNDTTYDTGGLVDVYKVTESFEVELYGDVESKIWEAKEEGLLVAVDAFNMHQYDDEHTGLFAHVDYSLNA